MAVARLSVAGRMGCGLANLEVQDGQIRGIEIVLPGNPNQGEQRIAPGIGEGGAHAVWSCRLSDRTHRPFRRHPFAGGVRQHGGQLNKPRLFLDSGGLHHRNLMLAQAFAHDLKPG